MATMLPSSTRTTVSVSFTLLEASGSRYFPMVPRSICLVFSVTEVTEGWMCSVMVSASSICGVTSSAMPEKNGVSVSEGSVVVLLLTLLLLALMEPPDTLVTKYSSVPTFSTAFWLLSVATRGLDRICRSPWLSRNPITA